jgi:alpha-mannosidase
MEKYQFARSEARAVLDQALNELASSVETKQGKGVPVVVFNSLNWTRSGIISIDFKNLNKELYVTDNSGKACIVENNKPGKLSFLAENIPPCGYKTFYIRFHSDTIIASALNPEPQLDPLVYENNFYKITFANGGIKSIFDKELNTELLETEKFLGGEVFTMRSEGTGAGEFADIQQPTMDGFDKTSLHEANWKRVENNLLYDKYSFRCKIRNAEIEEMLTVFRNEKRIDFNVALLNWDGEIYREFRMAMPLLMNDAQVSYEVPFGVVNVGKDEMEGTPGERHKTLCKDMHPRGVQNWISASDKKAGVTLSSSVAVADWIDPTTNPVKYTVLQPLLMAARRSCHGEGNEYLQTGDHHFSFSFTSHNPGWENGYRKALEANEEMQAILNPTMYKNASLPAELSFFSTDKENLLISTVKRAEDDNGFVVRVYDMSGKDTDSKISTFKTFQNAWQTDLLEYPKHEIKASGNIAEIFVGHNAIETFLFTK